MAARHLAPIAGFSWVLLALTASEAWAKITLPAVFGNHMVLPAGKVVPIWGRAEPGDVITITAAGSHARAVVDAAGNFRADLPAVSTSQPFDLVISSGGKGETPIVFRDVVAGEVWLASGQSNMEWPLYATDNAEADIAAATSPRVRIFTVRRPRPDRLSRTPVPVRGRWSLLTPESAARFSAVGVHFARHLAQARPHAIGIVHASWGGSRAEPWVRRSALKALPELRPSVAAMEAGIAPEVEEAHRQALAAWEASRPVDPGDRGTSLGWASVTAGNAGWSAVNLPAPVESIVGGPHDGVTWWRRTVDLPAGFRERPLFLRLGAIDQCDTTYVDGALVGASCENIAPESAPRVYPLPAYPLPAYPLPATTKSQLTIAVRVWDPGGPGGLLGPAHALRLAAERWDGPSLDLSGLWWWRSEPAASAVVAPSEPRPPAPAGFAHYQHPGVLWDNLIDGLAPFAFQGVLWYQGESNTKRAQAYRQLLPTLMRDWRHAFANPRLPFLIVQLAAHHPRGGPGQRPEEEWPELREAQADVVARDPHSALAITIDIGSRDDIHPRNKREVGRRLALLARARVHGETIPHAGPTYLGHRALPGGRLEVRFAHAEGLAPAGGPRLQGFEVAGSDRQYVIADARIIGDAPKDGDRVIVSAPTVARPVAVRYAWGDDPPCNLVNAAGLPAVPFRSDRWPRFSRRFPPD